MNEQELREAKERLTRLQLENKDLSTRMKSQNEHGEGERERGREGGGEGGRTSKSFPANPLLCTIRRGGGGRGRREGGMDGWREGGKGV